MDGKPEKGGVHNTKDYYMVPIKKGIEKNTRGLLPDVSTVCQWTIKPGWDKIKYELIG